MKHYLPVKTFYYKNSKYKILEEAMPDLLGEVIYNEKLIKINPCQGTKEYRKTIFHEILHIILQDAYHQDNGKIKMDEEELVLLLEKQVYKAKRDNVKLFKELFK